MTAFALFLLCNVVSCTARTDLRGLRSGDSWLEGDSASAHNNQDPDDDTGDAPAGGDPGAGDPGAGDPGAGDPGAGDPAGDPGGNSDPTVSVIGSVNEAGASYLDLAVDWPRALVYASSGAVDGCFDVIDFADESAPEVIARYNTTSTPATGCTKSRGLALFAASTRLVVTCGEQSTLEVWDVSADPRLTDPVLIVSISTYHPRRVPLIVEGATASFYINHRNSVRVHVYDELGPTVVEQDSWIGPDNQADATVVDQTYMLTGSWIADSPIQAIDLSDMTVADSFDMVNGANSNAFACAETSADQARAFVGGWVSAFFSYESGTSTLSLVRRFDNEAVYRDAVFVDDGGVYLYALRNDRVLDVFDATDPGPPVLTAQSRIPMGAGEAYALRVNTASRRILLSTTNGDFMVVDQDSLDATGGDYPGF